MKRVAASSTVPREGKRASRLDGLCDRAFILEEIPTVLLISKGVPDKANRLSTRKCKGLRLASTGASQYPPSCDLIHRIDRVPQSLSKLFQNPVGRRRQRSFNRASAGMLMPAAAQSLGDAGNIERTLAANGKPYPVIRQLPQKDGHLHPGNPNRVVHHPLAVFFSSRGAQHVLVRNPHPRQSPIAPQI